MEKTVKMTITEGLAEIKTINARVAKKQDAVMRYFARDGKMKDPLEKEGGTVEFVRRERQAIRDLQGRIITIRTSIQAANLATSLTIGDEELSVAEWLTWRREVSEKQKGFLSTMAITLNELRTRALRQGAMVTDKETGSMTEIVVAVNERELAGEVEQMEAVLGELDGKLSLLNATTFIEF